LEGFLLNLLVVENKQQTTVGPILILPDGRAIRNAQQEEKATRVRFLEIRPTGKLYSRRELRTTTTPVPIRYLNNYEEILSGERLARTTTPRPGLLEIVKAIRKYLFFKFSTG
jgi:hypothetical protein